MKPCVICGKLIKKKNSVMTMIYVCSSACNHVRKNNMPTRTSQLNICYWLNNGFTLNDATAKISEIQKLRSPRCLEYWQNKGYSYEESLSMVSTHQSNIAKKYSKKYSKLDRQIKNPKSPKYWIKKGFSPEDADSIIQKNNNTISLISYIKKYGNDVGLLKYNKLCQDRKVNYTLNGYIKKHGEEYGTYLWHKKFNNRSNSKKADIFFKQLIENIKPTYKIYTAHNENGEYGVKSLATGHYYLYDFVIPELKICIEYYGDYWHCNPTKYDNTFYHTRLKLSAGQVWERDKEKIDILKTVRGYDTIIVWESENVNQKIDYILERINEIEQSGN